jgi:hypothetical protein
VTNVYALRDDQLNYCEIPDDTETITIGRDALIKAGLRNTSVSGRHAKFRRERGLWVITDLDSRNGTEVNGFSIGTFGLRPGDDVKLGSLNLKFIYESREGLERQLAELNAARNSDGTFPMPVVNWQADWEGLHLSGIIEIVGRDDEHELVGKTLAELGCALSLTLPVQSRIVRSGRQIEIVTDLQDMREWRSSLAATIRPFQDDLHEHKLDATICMGIDQTESLFGDAHAALQLSRSRGGEIVAVGLPMLRAGRQQSRSSACFSWIHLSDLHFGAGSEYWGVERQVVLDALARDLGNYKPASEQRVFITGDIAFSAEWNQYLTAERWLAAAIGAVAPMNSIRCVPGNHDVERRDGDIIWTALHHYSRSLPSVFETMLAHDEVYELLMQKASNYAAFHDRLPGSMVRRRGGLDWMEDIDLPFGKIRNVGLSSVTVSDRNDGVTGDGVGNMHIAGSSLARFIGQAESHVFLVVLTHHPPHWFTSLTRSLFERTLSGRPHLHLCGHVHSATAERYIRLGSARTGYRYVAGASHAGPGEGHHHGYSWGAIRWNSRLSVWEIGWAPRTYIAERNEFRADRTALDLDADGFAWGPLDLAWGVPPRT